MAERTELQKWVASQARMAAEMICADFEDVPEDERPGALADYTADNVIYPATGEMAEAYRLLTPDKQEQMLMAACMELV